MSPVPNKPGTTPAGPSPKGDFEKSLARLEEVVKRMEGPDLSLDEAMKLFEEGVTLSRECQKLPATCADRSLNDHSCFRLLT